jgi:glycosyltransferase involved in cell wall biosynthesis
VRVSFGALGEGALRRHTERIRRALEAHRPGAIVDGGGDVTFTPSLLLPPVEGREVVCVHDFAKAHRPRLEERLARGSRVVCLSEATAGRIPEAEPVVIPPAVDGSVFAPAPVPEGEPFLAVVGSHRPLLDAFPEVRARMRPCRVVVVGETAPKRSSPAVDFVGLLDEADLVELYRRALLVVMPSFYEGYGPSVLEAMACGAPVACADTPLGRELAGDAARTFDPSDARSIADEMAALARSDEERAERRRRGIARAAQFPWETTADRLWRVLEEAAG